jgi:hypothetical protein
VAQALALGAERSSCRARALGVLDERAQLGEPGLGGRRVARQLVVPRRAAPSSRQAAAARRGA